MFVLSASSSDKEDAEANVQVWNPQSGTVQAVYKQASVPRHGLALLNPDCFVAASTGRAAIHFWNWRKEVPFLKATPPEKLGAVAASHKGIYCAGAGVSSGKVYIWDVSSGELLFSWEAHYRAVTALAWSACDALVYTGGEDALVKAWNSLDLLALGRDEALLKPLVVWNHHTLSITALCPAQGNLTRVASASVDRTAKILDLGTGSCLASIALPAAVNTVCLDPSQRLLFAGTTDGVIHKVAVGIPPSSSSDQRDDQASVELRGHTGSVTCLTVTPDEVILVSGGVDGSCRVWHIASGQMLLSFEKHKGPIAALLVLLTSQTTLNLAELSDASVMPVSNFKRFPSSGEAAEVRYAWELLCLALQLRLPLAGTKRAAPSEPDAATVDGADAEVISRLRRTLDASHQKVAGAGVASSQEETLVAQLEALREELAQARELNQRWRAVSNGLLRVGAVALATGTNVTDPAVQ